MQMIGAADDDAEPLTGYRVNRECQGLVIAPEVNRAGRGTS